MAEVKSITVSRSARVNLGNYEGLEHFISMSADLDDFDDEAEELQKLSAKVERSMVAMLCRSHKVRGKQSKPAVVAKHYGLSYVPKVEKE